MHALRPYLLIITLLLSCNDGNIVDATPDNSSSDQTSNPPEDFAPTDTEPGTVIPLTATNISAVWANEGGDKVVKEDTRMSRGETVTNSVFNQGKITLFGAKNEVVSFNLVLEAAHTAAEKVSLGFHTLTGASGHKIETTNINDLSKSTGRPIELFFIKYLEIRGKSAFMGIDYDQRHLPKRWQIPFQDAQGNSLKGGWTDRPDANKSYPEIAVPLELHPNFNIDKGYSQTIWGDIFIPKNTPTGLYKGSVSIKENGVLTRLIPVELAVLNFALPDAPSAPTMVNIGYREINRRFLGIDFPNDDTTEYMASKRIRDIFFQLAHRHKISLIDDNSGLKAGEDPDIPNSQWIPRLNGNLFTATAGYDGPGIGMGNNVYSIGTYSTWSFKNAARDVFWNRSNTLVDWFQASSPNTDYFLYLIDESPDYPLIEKWASWISTNPGVGRALKTLATISLPEAKQNTPSLSIPTSGMYVGDTNTWNNAQASYLNNPAKAFFMYNSGRPAVGSFMTEDDGTALRVIPWAQFKKKIHRWFYWESTYYNNFQGGTGDTDVFNKAHTFGSVSVSDASVGETGWNYSNGDGVLFYPGTDKIFPSSSYNIEIPFASLRLKLWRRGIQDADYLRLATAKNPLKTNEIINRVIPKVLWEYGVDDLGDPTYKRTSISWSDDPDIWEEARKELAEIILGE